MERTPVGTRAPSRARIAVILVTALALVLGQGVIVARGTWESMLRPQLISRSYTGDAPEDDSWDPRISGDGRYIVYTSDANDITEDDEDNGDDGERDVFRYDRETGETEMVSRSTIPTETVDRGSRDARISDDGRYVLFFTGFGFVPEDTNDGQDLYVKDMDTGTFQWIDFRGDGSPLSNNTYEWEISGDGSYVVFESDDYDLLDTGKTTVRRNVWGYDLGSLEATLVCAPTDPSAIADRGSRDPAISDDGRYVAFLTGNDWDESDSNGEQDIYVRDIVTGDMRWVDFYGDGTAINDNNWDIRMSGDGGTIAWYSDDELLPEDASDRRDVYAYDLDSDEATLVSGPGPDDRGSRESQLSYDGDTILFYTGQQLVPEDENGDQDMYLKDLVTGEYTRLPVMGENALPGEDVDYMSMSDDAMHIAFDCESDLVPEDDNDDQDDIYYVSTTQNTLSEGPTRLEGDTRYSTAIDVSAQAFPIGADTVVIATGEDWPDALGGAALAGAVDGPVLLTHSDWLDADVAAELMRLGARNVYLLGGYSAISPTVETQLEVMLSGFVWRIGGPDRYATSKAVANRTVEILGAEWDNKACVATGLDFPDAVGAAPLGAGLGWPVLLVRPTDPSVLMPPATGSVVILGGEEAVGSAVQTYLEGELGASEVDREGGADRYATSAMLAEYGVDHGLLWNGMGITSGTNFPDALTGGAALGLYRSTLVLTDPDWLSDPAATVLTDNAEEIEDVVFLGGTVAISQDVQDDVEAILGM